MEPRAQLFPRLAERGLLVLAGLPWAAGFPFGMGLGHPLFPKPCLFSLGEQ